MPTVYKQEVFDHLTDYVREINEASAATGISKEAIAGAIAEEYNTIISSLWSTLEEIYQVYAAVREHMESAIIVERPPNKR